MTNVLSVGVGSSANDTTGDPLRTAMTKIMTAVNGTASQWNGTSAPSSPMLYQFWFDTTSNPSVLKIWDGTQWVAAGSLNTSTHAFSPQGGATFTGDATGTFPDLHLLTSVNANVGSFGSSTAIPVITTNNKGQVTAVSTAAITAPAGTLTGGTLASGVTGSSLTSVGTLVGGATGAGFTIALTTSTVTGNLALANEPSIAAATMLANATNAGATPTAVTIPYSPPTGRLTLTTLVPVMTGSVTGATTVYYTPYIGNQIPLPNANGGGFVMTTFSQLSQATTDATKSPAAVAASSAYDIFVWNDAGTIRATRGPAWTNLTTRSAGTALVMNNGILVNNAAITNGPGAGLGVYVGSIASNASSTIDYIFGSSASGGGAAFLNVWNYYNRVQVQTIVQDSGTSYTYTTGTVRASRASNSNRVTFLFGLGEDGLLVSAFDITTCVGVAGANTSTGVALDSTTTFLSGIRRTIQNVGASTQSSGSTAVYTVPPQIGQHFIQAVEQGDSSNANTFNAASVNLLQVSFKN